MLKDLDQVNTIKNLYSTKTSSLCHLVGRCCNSTTIHMGWGENIDLIKFYNGLLVYSCCSHSEHRASEKHFVSLQFLNLRQRTVGLPGRVISSSQSRYLTQTQNKHRQTDMPRVGFEPTNPSVRASEDISYLRPRGHYDRLTVHIRSVNSLI
jgi:hypothetical protein